MTYFAFEADFVDSLRCIPMQVRYKLDTCGIKLRLQHWHQFSQQERQQLVVLPCTSPAEIEIYRTLIQKWVQQNTGQPVGELAVDPNPPWLQSDQLPEIVRHQAQDLGVAIAPEQWLQLLPLQRFALIKLSRPSHENGNFLPALREFGLAP